MNKSFIREVLRDYEKRRDDSIYSQKIRQEEVYSKIPRIKEIDMEISKTGFLISKAILQDPESYEEKVNEIKETMDSLKKEKAILMTENNIPLEYLDINYNCNKCKDTGFLENGNRCNCLRQVLIERSYRMSNLGNLLQKENFKTFNIDIFSTEPFEDEKLTPRENILDILQICEGFCFNFDEKNEENLLLYGTTGLGKTFMCNCIAKNLLDRGKIVIYQTAFNILDIISKHKFQPSYSVSIDESEYNLLFQSDLLIIDDLGTELTNSFTNTEIFNIVNSRLIKGQKTIISTNLAPMEIANVYTDRIFSRLFSQFTPLKFFGPDLRWERK
ncbi:putative DNA replication protein [Gottschalkia acidurici 9a]|uniref:DNA replication protein n=1 Tax=Gottschalkia acidurici (strain ATCC 7906 / DSM 604 / BCRC 14475 / CIP 104303 / KCTC 5404 / NCIMB 10678 / 9a) TaxID=1128398 RepID=K0B3Y6_GOTA9|nr:ATP-binding protein [Gottschalkia acidurici]AFS79837.1 putative DNA replication protein [Gottschalkia acidurici 9a]